MKELEGYRIFVSGSTSGIGKATAIEAARGGANVCVHGRSAERAGLVRDEILGLGVRAHAFVADLRDRDQGDELVERAWDVWGGLDAWVHCAGADTLTGANAKLSFDEKLDLLWEVDVVATIRLCRAVGERMKRAGGGSIVTIGWDQAETGMEGDSGQLFAATKGAVAAFTRSLAKSLAPEVRVNAIAPGWIKTAWGETASPVWQNRVLRETPAARWGKPEDVAHAARFLIGPNAGFVTGQIVRINGGAVM
jgi:3-oxoacyl-[acyl-carrier protein] reductase